jgi:hypothetical protein
MDIKCKKNRLVGLIYVKNISLLVLYLLLASVILEGFFKPDFSRVTEILIYCSISSYVILKAVVEVLRIDLRY